MKFWTWFRSFPWYVQVIFIGIVLFIIYQVYKWIKAKAESGNYNAAVNQSQTALTQLAQQGINPSYGQVQYTSWANMLQGQFEGCSAAGAAASFWEVIEPVFKGMKNDADIYALIKAYGVRSFDKCGLWNGDFNGDLSSSLSEKLTGLEGVIIGKTMSDINDILKKNSLTFTF